MKTIELLAPAKDIECGKLAIECGADAVYIGAPQFSARSAAHNSIENIAELIHFAHAFHARVYIALNTILYDHELEKAVQLIWKLYEIGADAIIIQDMGLLECQLPPIPLHASTQTNNRTLDKVQFLETAGFQQVVLARELSLDQIRAIAQNTTVPLEYFVHGALCVSYSGQCYISQSKTGRSANRGDCAQFCRHAYTLEDAEGEVIAKKKHLLSLKDLDLSQRLEELIDAGICSLKIEGRLKDASYVKNITTYYRQKLDAIMATRPDLQRPSSGNVYAGFRPEPQKTFNRGASTYFLDERQLAMVNQLSPKNAGQPIGKVTETGKGKVIVQTDMVLANGDGLAYIDSRGKLQGVRLSAIKNGWLTFNSDVRIPVNTVLYRNLDFEFSKQLQSSKVNRLIDIDIELAEMDNSFLLKAIDDDGTAASVQINFEKQLAQNMEKATATIETALRKTGNSKYNVRLVANTCSQIYFFPQKILNESRRQLLELLDDERVKKHQIQYQKLESTTHPYPVSESSYLDNVANAKAKSFYERHGMSVNAMAYELQKPDAEVPLMITKYCLRYELEMCPRFQNADNIERYKEPLFIRDDSNTFKLAFDCKRCEMLVLG